MGLHDATRQRQAQPRTAVGAAHEWFEQAVRDLAGHSRAVVSDLQDDRVAVEVAARGDRGRTRSARVDGVVVEGMKHPRDESALYPGLETRYDLVHPVGRIRRHVPTRLGEEPRDFGWLCLERVTPRERHNILDELLRRAGVALRLGQMGQAARRITSLGEAARNVCAARHDLEYVPELVCELGRNLAQSRDAEKGVAAVFILCHDDESMLAKTLAGERPRKTTYPCVVASARVWLGFGPAPKQRKFRP